MTQIHDDIVKNIQGGFAVEGIGISNQSLHNSERLPKGSISCEELISEVTKRYTSKIN